MEGFLRQIMPVLTWVFFGLSLLFLGISFFRSKKRGDKRLYLHGFFVFFIVSVLAFAYPIAIGFLDGYLLV